MAEVWRSWGGGASWRCLDAAVGAELRLVNAGDIVW
jgi:hypothetical protein